MTELLFNEFCSTYPFHMFAYLPLHAYLRCSGKRAILISVVAETVYLAIFAILVYLGFPAVYVQYLAIPFLEPSSTIWFRRISASSHSSTPLFWTT